MKVAPVQGHDPKVESSKGSQTISVPDLELSCEALDHHVGKGKKRKQILFSVSARFQSGQLCALMGPSGAGKTSLLGVLSAGVNKALKLNNQQLPKGFNRLCCTIPQADILFPALTAKQTLMYSAILRLPQSFQRAKIDKIVETLLSDLQLVKCKDTPVGNENIRGVSGGERKRVSIGTELVTNPKILFVDEPTSGLDSKMAEDTVRLLKTLSQRSGRIVICTIHQPSWSMFLNFDKLLLLHHGHVAYQGAVGDKLHEYFGKIGFQSPAFENPLDFYMRELQLKDLSDKGFFAEKWKALSDEEKATFDVVGSGDYSKEVSSEEMKQLICRNGFWHQFSTLLVRNARDTLIDKDKFLQGLMMKLGIAVMLGIIFINQARDLRNCDLTVEKCPEPTSSLSPLFFLVMSASFDTLLKAVMEYPSIRALVVREYKNGAFAFEPYFLAQFFNNLFFDTVSSLFYLPAYFLVGYAESFGNVLIFLAAVLLVTVSGTAMGLGVGSISKDFKEAQGYIMPILMPLLVFSGFLLPKSDIPDFFIWLYHLSPFQYCFSAVVVNEFQDRKMILEALGLQDVDIGENLLILTAIDIFLIVASYFIVRRSVIKQSKQS